MVINFDFRHGAKKTGHMDHPLQSYGQIDFDIFYKKLDDFGGPPAKSKKNIFINYMTWAIPGLRSEKFRKPESPEKTVSFRKYDFSGT